MLYHIPLYHTIFFYEFKLLSTKLSAIDQFSLQHERRKKSLLPPILVIRVHSTIKVHIDLKKQNHCCKGEEASKSIDCEAIFALPTVTNDYITPHQFPINDETFGFMINSTSPIQFRFINSLKYRRNIVKNVHRARESKNKSNFQSKSLCKSVLKIWHRCCIVILHRSIFICL